MDRGTLVMLLIYLLWFGFFFPFSPIISLHVSDCVQTKISQIFHFVWEAQLSLRKFFLSTLNCTRWYKVDFELYLFVTYFPLNI